MKPRLITFMILIIFAILAVQQASVDAEVVNNTKNKTEVTYGAEGVYIIINKATNVLKVYLNDYVVYRFRVGTGKNKNFTPEGSFLIITKIENPWYLPKNIAGGDSKNPLGTRWMGLNVPETSGYKYGIHGTNNPRSIGKYVSLGCIRMKNDDVEWLFRHIPLKTDVYIIDDPKQ